MYHRGLDTKRSLQLKTADLIVIQYQWKNWRIFNVQRTMIVVLINRQMVSQRLNSVACSRKEKLWQEYENKDLMKSVIIPLKAVSY